MISALEAVALNTAFQPLYCNIICSNSVITFYNLHLVSRHEKHDVLSTFVIIQKTFIKTSKSGFGYFVELTFKLISSMFIVKGRKKP